jgi:hypothetical protein
LSANPTLIAMESKLKDLETVNIKKDINSSMKKFFEKLYLTV